MDHDAQSRTLKTLLCLPVSSARAWLSMFAARGAFLVLLCMAMVGAWLLVTAPLARTLELAGVQQAMELAVPTLLVVAAIVYCASYGAVSITGNPGWGLLGLVLLPAVLFAPALLLFQIALPLYLGPQFGFCAGYGLTLTLLGLLGTVALAVPVGGTIGFIRTPVLEGWRRARRGLVFTGIGVPVVAVGVAVAAAIDYVPSTDEIDAIRPPTIARDGRWVTVQATLGGARDYGTLWTVDTRTGDVACVARGRAHSPAWIEGGERLTFLWDDYSTESTLWFGPPPSCRTVWVVDPDGRHLRRVALADWQVAALDVSPDGRWAIAYLDGSAHKPIAWVATLVNLEGGPVPNSNMPGEPVGWVSDDGRPQVLTRIARPGPLPGPEDDFALMLWDPASGTLSDDIIARVPSGVVRPSPDGRWAAVMGPQPDAGSQTSSTRILDLQEPERAPVAVEGRPVRWHPRAEALVVQRVEVSSGSGEESRIAFVDPRTGGVLGEIACATKYLPLIGWAPSGDRLVCAPWGSDPPAMRPRIVSWPGLDERSIEVPGSVVGWCSDTELITYEQPNLIWKIDVDTDARTQLFPPRG